jgi:hypothetical protein
MLRGASLAALPAISYGALERNPTSFRSVLRDIRSRFDFRYRLSWTTSNVRAKLLDRARPYHRMTVHHAGGAANYHEQEDDIARDLEAIRIHHRDRRFGDIGYHFVVDRVGRVWEARSLHFTGAHVLSQNSGNIGVMLLGNFEEQNPTSAQILALRGFTDLLVDRFSIPRNRVFGHRDLGHTLCPGKNLYGHVRDLKHV